MIDNCPFETVYTDGLLYIWNGHYILIIAWQIHIFFWECNKWKNGSFKAARKSENLSKGWLSSKAENSVWKNEGKFEIWTY